MAAVNVKLGNVGPHWTTACKQAVSDLNSLFLRKGIKVKLALNGAGPTIAVRTDPGILGSSVHGRTSAETDGAGQLLGAEVRLPVKLTINAPTGVRDAGTGMAEVIPAHEFVHALGHRSIGGIDREFGRPSKLTRLPRPAATRSGALLGLFKRPHQILHAP
jgi:hypothetical protein